MRRQQVNLNLHREVTEDGECWWAEAADFPGFTAAGDSKEECLDRTRAALKELIAQEPVLLALVWTEPALIDGPGGGNG